MGRKRTEEIEDLTVSLAPPIADAGTPSPASAPPRKHDYRFQMRGRLFAMQSITMQGVEGGVEEARKELHRWVDAAIVGIEANTIRDAKTLRDVANGFALFNDESTLPLPAKAIVKAETNDAGKPLAWTVTLDGLLKQWRPGFSWNRVRSEIEQLQVVRMKPAERSRTTLTGPRMQVVEA